MYNTSEINKSNNLEFNNPINLETIRSQEL